MLRLLLLQILAVSNSPNLVATRFETVTQSSSSMGQMAISSRTQGTFTGDRYRLDYLETSAPRSMMTAGTYMIIAANHYYVVDTAGKAYYEVDLAKMQSSVAAMLKQMPGMQMKFSNFKFDAQDLGDGEVLLGHPTRHWRVTGAMTMTGLMGGDTMAITIETAADHFFAKDMSVPLSGPSSNDSSALMQFAEMVPASDAAKMRNTMKLLPRSVDLKSESSVTSYIGPMDVAVKTTARVIRIETVNVDASYFEIPTGYKKVEMPLPTSPPGSM